MSFVFVVVVVVVVVAISWAAPAAYGSSQAKGGIGTAAASLCHSRSNAESKPHLRPTLQLMAVGWELLHYSLLQDIEYCSLSYTVGSCYLSIFFFFCLLSFFFFFVV
ncbi:MAG: hypothetical protein SPF10_03735, partial [Phascolarctobacterium sp.]|nr:hypothetical protein [Phascolarctobacterium sp.]